jgi:hypothetical protein
VYESLVLIDPEGSLGLEGLAAELRRFYAKSSADQCPTEIKVTGSSLTLRWPYYRIDIHHSTAPHVLEESEEIADRWAGSHPERDRISKCRERLEISGEDDPDMEYFNDCLFVGEAAERLTKVFRFDQASAEFLN